ncbi:glycinol 4-dimethylallyltransferase-like isoform X2 [Lotus japonicus]|uniref:glycinol 4-dimethylallyltransferase-like isoform X2 n=1 Tax=Lotus japonicus TaxID=34305 RepID=UPI00258F6CD0|nr:glycinol 4-dimethylallyltransferase-like isoform X2 [Lotus japonicus]
MESLLVGSFPHASSVTTGGSLLPHIHGANKKIYYARSYAPKASQQKRKVQNKYNLQFGEPSLNNHYKCIEGDSPNKKCNRKYIVKASSEPSFESEPNACDPKTVLHSVKNFLVAFQKFSRPFSMVGIISNIIATSLLTVEKLSDISPLFFTNVLKALVLNLTMSIYVNGVNQLFDVEIDKSFWLAWIIGSWSFIWGVLAQSIVGFVYSANVPLLRWKRHPVLAAMCLVSLSAFILPITIFIHFQTFVFKRMTIFWRPLISVIAFTSLYFVGISLCKDIPDMEGDKAFGINSFSTRFGTKQAFWLSVTLFKMAFGVALFTAATSSYLWSKVITGLGYAVLASILWYNAKSVDLGSKDSVQSFYIFIWKLLSAHYFLVPFVR